MVFVMNGSIPNDQIHLVKEPLKEGQLQFVSIDEQTLAWLEKYSKQK